MTPWPAALWLIAREDGQRACVRWEATAQADGSAELVRDEATLQVDGREIVGWSVALDGSASAGRCLDRPEAEPVDAEGRWRLAHADWFTAEAACARALAAGAPPTPVDDCAARALSAIDAALPRPVRDDDPLLARMRSSGLAWVKAGAGCGRWAFAPDPDDPRSGSISRTVVEPDGTRWTRSFGYEYQVRGRIDLLGPEDLRERPDGSGSGSELMCGESYGVIEGAQGAVVGGQRWFRSRAACAAAPAMADEPSVLSGC